MPSVLSFMNLHLQCRLWIAELNWDINMLRIYNDHLQELAAKPEGSGLKDRIGDFEALFPEMRKDIDDLRNDLHLLKMKLATYVREEKIFDEATFKSSGYEELKKRLLAFQKNFGKVKLDLNAIETNFTQIFRGG
jgi:hypothetical protein